MPIDSSIADLAWLLKPADPGASLAQGAAVGSAIAHNYQAGAALAQRQMALEAELRQLPLKQTLEQQQADMNAVKLTDILQTRQDIIANEQAFQGLAAQIGRDLQSDDPTAAEISYWDAISRNRGLYKHPGMKPLLEDTRAGLAAKTELARIRAAQKANDFTTPRAVEVPSPKQGEPPYTAIQIGPNSYTLPQSTVTEWTAPDGTTFSQRTGAGGVPAGGGAGSAALNNRLETKLSDTSRASALLDESLSLISPSNIGPRGKLNAAVETAANIIAPGSMPTPTVEARATFNTTAQGLYNSLKADSQINKMEAAAISKLADITDWFEASKTATGKYQTLRNLTGLQSVLTSHQLNRITPDNLLRGMSLDFVDKYAAQGVITKAEMRRWIDMHGGDEAVEKMILNSR